MTDAFTLRSGLAVLWRTDRFLTAVGLLLLAALVPMTVGLLLDPRTIGGAPAWMKPAKFALSTGVYSLTLVWIFSWLPEWRRVRRFAGVATGLVFVVEVAIIAGQAWRGTTSHFNVGTPLDAALYQVMGAGIMLQTMAAAVAAIAVWRHRFADRAMGFAIRLGLTITIIGAGAGGLMTQATDTQRATAAAGVRMTVQGAHTVGGPDGGAGLPVTGWSLEHGDLRVAHFLGLHAVQALPLLVVVLRARRVATPVAARLVVAAAASHVSLFLLLLWQALRGESLAQADATTLMALGAWGVGSALVFWVARRGGTNRSAARPRWAAV